MGFKRGINGSLEFTRCELYCQTSSNKICGNGCRNMSKIGELTNDEFFSDVKLENYHQFFKGTEEHYKNKISGILKNIY